MSRDLTSGERGVLQLIQAHYGPQNTEDDLTWLDDEAVIWVKDKDGEPVLMANISNLASWHEEGAISDDDLLDHLNIPRTQIQ